MSKQKETEPVVGLEMNGFLFKEDGTNLSWADFVSLMDNNGLRYSGMTRLIDLDEEKGVRRQC